MSPTLLQIFYRSSTDLLQIFYKYRPRAHHGHTTGTPIDVLHTTGTPIDVLHTTGTPIDVLHTTGTTIDVLYTTNKCDPATHSATTTLYDTAIRRSCPCLPNRHDLSHPIHNTCRMCRSPTTVYDCIYFEKLDFLKFEEL